MVEWSFQYQVTTSRLIYLLISFNLCKLRRQKNQFIVTTKIITDIGRGRVVGMPTRLPLDDSSSNPCQYVFSDYLYKNTKINIGSVKKPEL